MWLTVELEWECGITGRPADSNRWASMHSLRVRHYVTAGLPLMSYSHSSSTADNQFSRNLNPLYFRLENLNPFTNLKSETENQLWMRNCGFSFFTSISMKDWYISFLPRNLNPITPWENLFWDHPLWLTVSSTGHFCNEYNLSRC